MNAIFSLLLAFAPLGASGATLNAQDRTAYPQRTVTFVCPFPAGGGTDILTRMLASEASRCFMIVSATP